MGMPGLSWSFSHGWRKHVTISTPVSSTTEISTSVSCGRGRFSFTSWTWPWIVHDPPMRAVATVSRFDRST